MPRDTIQPPGAVPRVNARAAGVSMQLRIDDWSYRPVRSRPACSSRPQGKARRSSLTSPDPDTHETLGKTRVQAPGRPQPRRLGDPSRIIQLRDVNPAPGTARVYGNPDLPRFPEPHLRRDAGDDPLSARAADDVRKRSTARVELRPGRQRGTALLQRTKPENLAPQSLRYPRWG